MFIYVYNKHMCSFLAIYATEMSPSPAKKATCIQVITIQS